MIRLSETALLSIICSSISDAFIAQFRSTSITTRSSNTPHTLNNSTVGIRRRLASTKDADCPSQT